MKMFASRFLGKIYSELFFDAFQISKKLCLTDNEMNKTNKRPYLVLNADQRSYFEDNMMKVTCDIFKRRITFSSGNIE